METINKQQWTRTAEELHKLRQLRKEYEKQEKIALERLLALSNHTSFTDGRFVCKSYTRAGSIDYKKIPELKYINLDTYRREEITMWKFESLMD